MTEIYRDVIGYEGLYQVSNFGNVKSCSRKIKHYRGGFRISREKLMVLRDDAYGYYYIGLRKNNKQKLFKIHSLVYRTFIGEITNNLQIDHIDNNRKNNTPQNLRLVNSRENQNNRLDQSRFGVGISLRPSGEFRACIKIQNKQVHLGQFKTFKEASSKYLEVFEILSELEKSNKKFDFERIKTGNIYSIKFNVYE